MATPIELQKRISDLKKALSAKGVPPALKAKLKAKLDTAQDDLNAIKKKRLSGATAASQSKAVGRLSELIKKAKYAIYKGSGVDLQKDSKQPALAGGKRVSKGLKANQFGSKKANKGNVYYENRPNRLDVKQPPKRYPKLKDGGYMAGGGETAGFEVDDVVYHKGHNTVGIVRMGEERGEVKTDADGNVNVDELEYYNPLKHEAHKNAKVAPSTLKEIEERMLWKPFSERTAKLEKGGYMAGGGDVGSMEDNIKKYLAAFPDDAQSWDKATDEVRDLARSAREHLEEYDNEKIEPLNFRELGTPSEWNTQGKKYIFMAWGKMSSDTKKKYYERWSEWLDKKMDKGGYMEGGGWLIEDENEKRRIVAGAEKPKVGSKRVDSDGKSVIVKKVLSMVGKKSLRAKSEGQAGQRPYIKVGYYLDPTGKKYFTYNEQTGKRSGTFKTKKEAEDSLKGKQYAEGGMMEKGGKIETYAQRFKKFINELEELSNKTGIAISSTGGVYDNSFGEKTSYSNDWTSGDIMPNGRKSRISEDAPTNYYKFIDGLEKISNKYKIGVYVVGGVNYNQSNVVYDTDPTSADIRFETLNNSMAKGGYMAGGGMAAEVGAVYTAISDGKIGIYSGSDAHSADVKKGDKFIVESENTNYFLGDLNTKGTLKWSAGLSGANAEGYRDGKLVFVLMKSNIDGGSDYFAQFTKSKLADGGTMAKGGELHRMDGGE